MSKRQQDQREINAAQAAKLNEEEERTFVGSALLYSTEVVERLKHVRPDEFYLRPLGAAWATICEIFEAGALVTPETVTRALGKKKLHSAGNSIFLSSLTDYVPKQFKLAVLDEYAVRIKERATRRRAQLDAYRFAKQLADGVDVDEAKRTLIESMEAPAPAASKVSSLEVVCIDDVEPLPINWLWKPYLAKGMLHILNGNAYAGKTFIAMALSAGVTVGRMPFSEERFEPRNVLYLQNENAIAQTMRPRFDLTDGDRKRFHLVIGTVWSDGEKQHHGGVSLGEFDKLEEAFQKYRPGLLVVDPFTGYIGAGVDMYRANEIRPIMEGLGKLAEQYQVCVLLMRHFSKGSVGMNSMHRGMGSVDFTNVARSELFAAILPDEDGRVPRSGPGPRALVHGASNIGPVGDSLEYRIGNNGVFGWIGTLDLDLEQLMNPETVQDTQDAGRLQVAVDWLKEYLTPNSQNSKDVEKAAKQEHIAFRTLLRAKDVLKVKARKTSIKGGWIWFLPGCGTEKEDGSGPLPVQ